jgi:bifunctional non-homologous end joining protein LigD
MQRADAIAYYKAVSRFILPHLRNRPLSFQRYVDAIPGEFFWEKDAPSFTPQWVKTFPVPRREGPDIDYIVANDAKTLTWLASIGAVDLHPFLHVAPRIDVATHVVFDLDPGEGADLLDCAEVAFLLRDLIELECFAKVSGSKGIQVYVPLNSGASHELTEAYARVIADELARRHPKLVVSKMAKTLRHKKVFIDWSQNADYKTTVAVYSLRANRGLVSMPVTWEELKRGKKLEFTPKQAIARLKKVGDLFAPVLKLKQKLPGQKKSSALERRALSPARGRAESPSLQRELPKRGSQSGRRLFLLTKTETGNELWTEMGGLFRRWILRPDKHGGERLIAVPAGEFAIDPAYYRAEVPQKYKGRVEIADSGAYEIVEGSDASERFALWFSGSVMQGAWTLEKIEKGSEHRSWSLSSDSRR